MHCVTFAEGYVDEKPNLVDGKFVFVNQRIYFTMKLKLNTFAIGVLLLFGASHVLGQSNYQQVVEATGSGNKVLLDINLMHLQQSMDSIFLQLTESSTTNWGDVLINGSNPGMDIDFSSYEITGLGGLTSTGTLTADSLFLNKDADLTGKLSVTDVVSFGDSLTVSGYVQFSDSLNVVKAVAIGETLYVTGVTALGDSLHVVGNVDLDALFNVDGAATFGSTLAVSGKTTLSDSLLVNSGARISGTLYADSAVVVDVINGQVSSLANHTTSGLAEGTNLYFTNERAIEALSDTLSYLLGLIAQLQDGGLGGGLGGGSDAFTCGTSTVTFDGHDYSTVLIGDQCWFAENLRTTQYADGSAIPEVTDASAWATTTDGARGAYNDDAGNLATYGYLYNWYAVDSAAGLCPTGWHVPTDAEWTTLTDGLGGASVAGGAMKSSASDTPAWDGTNSSGFSALPGGTRFGSGSFFYVGLFGYWWSASPSNSTYAWYRSLNSGYNNVDRPTNAQWVGLSVRCVGDAAVVSSASAPTVSSGAASDLAETTATLNGTVDADGGDAVTATGFVWGTDALLSGASDASGSATSGAFTASLTGLTGGTTYYFSAYAANGEGTDYGDTLSFTTTPAAAAFTCGTSAVTFDGHAYSTVEIGSQCWFAENLRTTKYADGSAIPEVTDASAWATTTDGARGAYNNDAGNLATYGYLYNWYAVDSAAGLCPTDWHVPTDAEWTTLTDGLGGLSLAGEAMKSSASDTPAWNGTNTSGFSALPGGIRFAFANFYAYVGSDGYWWSASPEGTEAWYRRIEGGYDNVFRMSNNLRTGLSVRCVRD
jgi:uncharacterized protein (TIGR02145 family)